MISRQLYFRIVLWVCGISIAAIGAGLYISINGDYGILFIAIPLIILLSATLVRYLNKTNRRMAYFFDAIKNDDTNIQLPNDVECKSIHELYKSVSFLIDKLKQTKIEISYNEQLFKALIENSSAGFITIDENGTFKILNSIARQYINVEHTTNFAKLKDTDFELYKILKDIEPGKKYIHRINRPQIHLILSISAAIIKYYNKEYRVIILQDITRELADQELESWHKLFRVITHEIMNSIAPITSLTEKINSYFKNGREVIEASKVDQKLINKTVKGLSIIDDMSNGLLHFVENYRQLNKIHQPKLSEIYLNDWLPKLKALLLELVNEPKPNIILQLDPNLKAFIADEKLLNQVIINLFLNALDAVKSNESAKIKIKLEHADGGKTLLQVIDNGVGIASEHIEKVMVPFFTTKDQGNGIGLSLSKQIIQQHGGSLNIQSEVNRGTCVSILV